MFRDQLIIYGKYANLLKKYSRDKQGEKVLFTVTDNNGVTKEIFIFDNYLQGYMISAMLGIYNQRFIPDDGDRSEEAKIFADILAKRKCDLDTIVQLMILSEKDGSVDKKIKDAFSVEKPNEKDIEKRVTSYARGGLMIVDEIFGSCTTYEDVANAILVFDQELAEGEQ